MGLIDAYKAMESIDKIVCSMSVCINSDYCNGMLSMKDMALHAIENQPTVDAVPVTVCAKCKHNRRCMFQSFVIDNGSYYDENTFFCADGEREVQE